MKKIILLAVTVALVLSARQVLSGLCGGFTFGPGFADCGISFTGTPPLGCTVTSWLWDFGDGNTSTQQNPSHWYASAGQYTVCLLTVGTSGVDTTCQLVPVSVGSAEFSNSSACPVDFTDESTGFCSLSSWLWDFGDGNISTQQNPSHSYAATGTYTVCLTGTGSLGSDSTCHTVQGAPAITEGPTPDVPPHGAVAVSTSPLFTWSSVTGLGDYEIEIATDANFFTIVDSASGLGTESHAGSTLAALTPHFWRVRKVNSCGAGPWSSVFSFTTGVEQCATVMSTDVPVAISAAGTPIVQSTLAVAPSGVVGDVNVVSLRGTHTWINDLEVLLANPAGATYQIMAQSCDNEDDFDLNLDDEAAPGPWPCPPVGGGTYQPSGPLASFDGSGGGGTWTLTVFDQADGDGGSLDAWGLEVCQWLTALPVDIFSDGFESGSTITWSSQAP